MQSKLSRKLEEGSDDSWSLHMAGGDDGTKRNGVMKRCVACASIMFICFKLASCSERCHLHSVYIVGREQCGSSVCFETFYVLWRVDCVGLVLYYR